MYAPRGRGVNGWRRQSAFGFTNEYTDATGLLYLRARYYDPSQGRFFQPDPSRQEANPYQYGFGNPVNYSDPSGLICVNGVDKRPYNILPCHSGWDVGVAASSTAEFARYLSTGAGAFTLVHEAGMNLGGSFILRQHRLMNYERYYSHEGGDQEYLADFQAQGSVAIRFQFAALQAADVAGPTSEILTAAGLVMCTDDVARVVITETFDGDGYYDDISREITQELVDDELLVWQNNFQPMSQSNAPDIRAQASGGSRAIDDLVSSKKGVLKSAQLPTQGRIRFMPPEYWTPSQPLRRGPNNGYLDRFGNEWVRGPSRTAGDPFEWDVQLSNTGRHQLGWLSSDGQHINVSLNGEITH